MARLLVAVVNDADAERVVEVLRDAGHRLTEIPSFGGFLHGQNTTLLVGVEDEEAEKAVLGVFERECSARDVEVPEDLLSRLAEGTTHVRYGGATIFQIDLAGVRRV